jgi:DNA-binding protein HU-beta
MNTKQLIEIVAKETKLTKAQAQVAVKATLSTIKKTVSKKKESVQLTDFGTFKVVKRKARNGVKPGTTERIKIPAKNVVRFSVGRGLKKAVK